MYFEQAGKNNTEKTLSLAKDVAKERGIKYMVVASTYGDSGIQAARLLQGTGIKLVVVTHSTGFKEPGKQFFNAEAKKEIENLGGTVHTGTDSLTGFLIAMREKGWFSVETLISSVLRMFGQGMKVCVEITAMAADAGLIPMEDIVAIGGTGRGADTAVVVAPSSTSHFFDIKIREILAKPKDF